MRKTLISLALFVTSFSSQAHEYVDLEGFFDSIGGVDLDAVEITSVEVGEGLHVLFGNGGNIIASIGDQGTLIVDTMFAPLVPKIQQAVRDLGGESIEFAINTHFHFDHADGNPLLARSGTNIVAHANARRSMVGEHPVDLVFVNYLQPPYPKDTLPIITYEDHMQFHYNGETIDLLHIAPAHTSGDTVVYFRNSNIVHMGDVFNAGYPFIDAGNGGDIDGMINFLKGVLHSIEEDTTVLPGHGPLMTYQDMEDYVIMLETVRDRIGRLIDNGNSLEEVMAAQPAREFDDRYGDSFLLINRAYMNLSQ